MNRGSPVVVDRFCGRFEPSMRPRFMNRGSVQYDVQGNPYCPSFNEAPIHESGK